MNNNTSFFLIPHNDPSKNDMQGAFSIIIHDFIHHSLYLFSVSNVTIGQTMDWGTKHLWKVMYNSLNVDFICDDIHTVVQESVFHPG